MSSSGRIAAFALSVLATQTSGAEIEFDPVQAPIEDATKRQVIASPSVTISGQKQDIGFHVLARTGDAIGQGTFGEIVDHDGKSLPDPDSFEGVPNRADYMSFLSVGARLFSIGHFESRPGALYLTELAQDDTGQLTAEGTRPIDLSAIGGIWSPCAGIVTPWQTHLGSEEGPPDAHNFELATSLKDLKGEIDMATYFGLDPATLTFDAVRAAVNPYRYGYVTEAVVAEDGAVRVRKHGAMGRMSVELANVMPDRKTAYITDDTTNGGLFRFVADTPDDLSSGQLFAAQWVQTSGEDGGTATLKWIDLGHADDANVQSAIESGITFSALFDTADMIEGGKCPAGFTSSNAETRAECLKVKQGMEMLASRLETRRYAALLGATTEFNKFEGTAIDIESRTFYLASADVAAGMEDNSFEDFGGPNAIRLPENGCGAVFAMTLDENWVGRTIAAAIVGKPAKYGSDSPYEGQTCDIDGVANPDNLTFIPAAGQLIVAEDTSKGHQNDAIWAFDIEDKTLTRILTTPYGAEATAVNWHANLNGHAYLSVVIQHPYGETDQAKAKDRADTRAYVGYLGPFPVME